MRIDRTTTIDRTPRVIQTEGMFSMDTAERLHFTVEANLPLTEQAWQIGAIVGPSGSGKSTILNELFGKPADLEWPHSQSVVDGFDSALSIADITNTLSSVGFSSPPAWLRPHDTLSNGEQFRANVARTLLEAGDLAVIDEFTSVVDRTVAKIGSSAVAKHVRRGSKQLVVASCHYDVLEWLTPDWVFDTLTGEFRWECLQRPPIELEIYRSTTDAWSIFHRHHYLTGELSRSAACYVALVEGRPAAFASYINFPHPKIRHAKRMHRMVCLPDFQGVGIGNRLAEVVASLAKSKGNRVFTTQAHPAVIRHQARSPLWNMTAKPRMVPPSGRTSTLGIKTASNRLTASFEYVGPPASAELQQIG